MLKAEHAGRARGFALLALEQLERGALTRALQTVRWAFECAVGGDLTRADWSACYTAWDAVVAAVRQLQRVAECARALRAGELAEMED